MIVTMAARIEINELDDLPRQKIIIDAVEALEGVIETKTDKGALYVSYDPRTTAEQRSSRPSAPRGEHQNCSHRYGKRSSEPASAADISSLRSENVRD